MPDYHVMVSVDDLSLLLNNLTSRTNPNTQDPCTVAHYDSICERPRIISILKKNKASKIKLGFIDDLRAKQK